MADRVSAAERLLIDEAIANGQVRRIAQGTGAFTDPEVASAHASWRRPGRPRKPQSSDVVPIPGVPADKANQRRAAAAARKVEKLADRRRMKITPVPGVDAPRSAPASATGTLFPNRVEDPRDGISVLKDGRHNSKIGGDVLKGRLKGARIFTLTLEERETCPRTCHAWRICYGNGMSHSVRWRHGAELQARLIDEISALCAQHDRVLIRLHVLGDFYSVGYVNLWAELLWRHPNLFVFGFTAWAPPTPIGTSIVRLRLVLPQRFMIRHSGMGGRWGSYVLADADHAGSVAMFPDAAVCPEQADAMAGKQGRHCGSCALCWQSDLNIVFVPH